MTMPWSTQDAEEDALALTDASVEQLLGSLDELESPFFVHLVIEAALLSARVSAYGILLQPQAGFDGEEANDFILQRDRLDIEAVVRLEALLGFQHVLLFSRHPDNREALAALMEWPSDDGRIEERLTAVYRRAVFASVDDSFDWAILDDIADSWRRDQAREDGPIHAALLNGHLVRSTLDMPPIAETAMITSAANFDTITAVQQDVFRSEVIRLWGEWAK
ncbi:MAG TPA: hypothetical protein VGF64_00835 [Acidimicrobiales bacterium]|jgi:hypothetical protein